jgi:transposase
MADYPGKGLTGHMGARLVLLLNAVFRTHHRYEAESLDEQSWPRRMQRLRRSLNALLEKGTQVPAARYAGRCQHILRHEPGLWGFLRYRDVPLTNNEAERCLRGSVIMRKICYGTSSERGREVPLPCAFRHRNLQKTWTGTPVRDQRYRVSRYRPTGLS